jgi:hypothetical protein
MNKQKTLCGVAGPFAIYLCYNWLLSLLKFEFTSVNTARIVNASVHTLLWALLGISLRHMLSILWTNLLWTNLTASDTTNGGADEKQQQGCSSDVLCWLTSQPLSGVQKVTKLRTGYSIATVAFTILYMETFVKGLFPNVNPLRTVIRGAGSESEATAGWFNVNMMEAVPTGDNIYFLNGWFAANAHPAVNEVQVPLDGAMTRMWIPRTLKLSEWYTVTSPVVFPRVECKAIPLWGPKNATERTAYPLGKATSLTMSTSQGLRTAAYSPKLKKLLGFASQRTPEAI